MEENKTEVIETTEQVETKEPNESSTNTRNKPQSELISEKEYDKPIYKRFKSSEDERI